MRRDPHESPESPSSPGAGDATESQPGSELLTAYVDGGAELPPDERHQVAALLAGDPQARADQAAVRTLLDQLRELPAAGVEPDWAAMERSIRQAVGSSVPRPWWRRWKWLAPSAVLATAVAVMLVMLARPAAVTEPEVHRIANLGSHDPGSHDPQPTENVVRLWLDGAEVDVDLSASDLLGALEAREPGQPGQPDDDNPVQPGPDADAEVDLLPSTNLAWVDQLDEDAIARAERWLARKKG